MKHFFFILFMLANHNVICQNINLINNGGFDYYRLDTTTGIYPGQVLKDTDANSSNHCWFRPGKKIGAIWPIINPYNPLNPRPYSDSNSFHVENEYSYGYKISTASIFTTIVDSCRFYGQNRLKKPLVGGKTYTFSMYVGDYLADSIKFQSTDNPSTMSNIGVYFSVNKLADYNNPGQLQVKPQINFTNYTFPKMDTFEFIKLSATYTAQGGEQYLTIGNFDSVQNFVYSNLTKAQKIKDTVFVSVQFLLIDDVSLVEDGNLPIINPGLFTIGTDTTICYGSTIALSAPEYYTDYLWNTGETNEQIMINQPGKYWCVANAGCTTYSDTVVVSLINKPPSRFLTNDTSLCITESIILSALNNYNYLWNTGELTQTIQTTKSAIYWCTISDECGSQTDSIKIELVPCTLFFPTAFSPNQDGKNDDFKPITTDVDDLEYSIYNRYGNCVFTNDNALFGWDGKYKTVDCPIGTYFYICKYKINNQEKILKGDFELVR